MLSINSNINSSIFVILIVTIISTVFKCKGDDAFDLLATLFNDHGPHDDKTGSDMFGKTTEQLLRLRGYDAEVYNVSIGPNINLNLVRIVNPHFIDEPVNLARSPNKFKETVLFLHGITSSANYFLVNSIDARPRDWSHIDAPNLNQSQLVHLLEKDPASKSLALMMSNFGHDVWLLNRRPTLESQAASSEIETNKFGQKLDEAWEKLTSSKGSLIKNLIDSTKYQVRFLQTQAEKLRLASMKPISDLRQGEILLNELGYIFETFSIANIRHKFVNPNYWRFAFDKQASIDLPKVIDFILAKTNRSRVNIVGHSLGAALPLMTMTVLPQYEFKIGYCILFAPTIDLAYPVGLSPKLLRRIMPFLQAFDGPVGPGLTTPLTQSLGQNLCNNKIKQLTVCNTFISSAYGDGVNQLENFPGLYYATSIPVSSRELVQSLQSFGMRQLHFYDFGNNQQNFFIYGNITAPAYNMSLIKNARLSFYAGNTDALVPPEIAKQFLVQDLKIPVESHVFDEPGYKFNHLSYQFHKSVVTKINIPIIKSFETKYRTMPSDNMIN